MITINGAELRRFKLAADAVDKRIVRTLRVQLKAAAQDAVDAVKENLAAAPPNDQPGSVGSRDALAKGTRLVVSFPKKGVGLSIRTTGQYLGGQHKGFARAYETLRLNHPVYGRSDSVGQPTRPYFGQTIKKVMPDRGQAAMKAVFEDAVRAIGGHGS